MQHDHVLKKLHFVLLTPSPGSGGGGGGEVRGMRQNINYHSCIRVSLQFDMQHDCVLKKLNLELLIPSPKSTQWVRHMPSIENHV